MNDEDLAGIRDWLHNTPENADPYTTRHAARHLLAEVERLRVDLGKMQQSKYRAYEHVDRLKRENAAMRKIVQAVVESWQAEDEEDA